MHDRHMRAAIVTGASRGLGLALTRELLSCGWKVVIDARDAAALAEVSQHLAGSRCSGRASWREYAV